MLKNNYILKTNPRFIVPLNTSLIYSLIQKGAYIDWIFNELFASIFESFREYNARMKKANIYESIINDNKGGYNPYLCYGEKINSLLEFYK